MFYHRNMVSSIKTPQIKIREMRFDKARGIFLNEIEKYFLQGEQEVHVLHGIGEYILRDMVIEECKKIDYVEVLSTPPGIHPNDGILRLRILAPEKSVLDKYLERK